MWYMKNKARTVSLPDSKYKMKLFKIMWYQFLFSISYDQCSWCHQQVFPSISSGKVKAMEVVCIVLGVSRSALSKNTYRGIIHLGLGFCVIVYGP